MKCVYKYIVHHHTVVCLYTYKYSVIKLRTKAQEIFVFIIYGEDNLSKCLFQAEVGHEKLIFGENVPNFSSCQSKL